MSRRRKSRQWTDTFGTSRSGRGRSMRGRRSLKAWNTSNAVFLRVLAEWMFSGEEPLVVRSLGSDGNVEFVRGKSC